MLSYSHNTVTGFVVIKQLNRFARLTQTGKKFLSNNYMAESFFLNREHYSFSAQNIVDSHQARTMQLSEYYHQNTCEQGPNTRSVHRKYKIQFIVFQHNQRSQIFDAQTFCLFSDSYVGTYTHIAKENKSFLFCAYNVFLIYAVFRMVARMGQQIEIFIIMYKQGIISLNQFTAVPLYTDYRYKRECEKQPKLASVALYSAMPSVCYGQLIFNNNLVAVSYIIRKRDQYMYVYVYFIA